MKQGKASIFMLVACALTAPMFSLIKWAGQFAPASQVIFFHFLAALLITGGLHLASSSTTWKVRGRKLFSIRAIFWLITTLGIFNASTLLPVVHVSLFLNTAPLFVPLIAIFWLKEQIPLLLWGGLLIGFIGTALVLQPSGEIGILGIVLALGAALASAGSMVATQRLVRQNPPLLLSFYLLAIGAGLGAVTLPFMWQHMPWKPICLSLCSGTLFAAELYCFTKAFSYSSAARLGPLNYAGVAISGLISWLVWSDKLDVISWIGIVLVCIGGSLSFLIPRAKTLKST